MNSKKGFTLIELIAVIVILGLVVLIAIPFFQGSLKTFRDDYYSSLEVNITNAGKNFFNDNRLFLPTRYLEAAKVDLDTLNAENYINEVKDYNGDSCDINASYVIAVKVSREKYEYALCMKCSEDDYENTSSPYCDSAWDDNYGYRKVVFEDPEPVYVYVGTTREQLKKDVKVYPTIKRCRGLDEACTDYVKEVSAKGEDGINPIYPKDLDQVNPDAIGTYKVHYQLDEVSPEKEGNVIVYRNPESTVTFKKLNKIFSQTVSNSVVGENDPEKTLSYDHTTSTDWAQRIKVIFDDPFVDEHGNPVSGAYASDDPSEKIYVARYQWYTGGRWQDLCVPQKNHNDCTEYIGRDAKTDYQVELNDDVKFRYIDSNGKISEETSAYKFRIDYTKPDQCSLKLTGTLKNGWYVDNSVKIEFQAKDDATTTSSKTGTSVKSGMVRYKVVTGGTRPTDNKNEDYQTLDTRSVTWYGYIEDRANNYKICSTTFKKDSKPPTCSISGHADLKVTDATSGITKVFWSQTNNQTSNGTIPSNIYTWTNTPTVSKEGRWYLRATDDAQWECQTSSMYCKITYDPNGGTTPKKGSATKTSEILRETEKADLDVTTTKAGYTFHGWSESATAASSAALTDYTVKSEERRTLYAVWSILNPQNVSISGGTTKIYGSSSTTLTCSQTRTYASETTLYYSFGYSTTEGGTPGNWTTASTTNTHTIGSTDYYGDRYYYCKVYAKNSYLTSDTIQSSGKQLVRYNNATITFDGNNGTVSGTNPVYVRTGNAGAFTGIRNNTAATLPSASRNCYTLNGWHTAASGGSKVLNSNNTFTGSAVSGYTNASSWAATENKTLYAQWTPNTYTISYDYTGGTPTSFTYGVGATVTGTASRTGYTFNGWQYGSSKAFSHTVSTTACSNQSLTALWCQNCVSPVSNGSCSLNASTAGTCTYTTKCNSGYTLKHGASTRDPKCCQNCASVSNGTCTLKWSNGCAYDTSCNSGYTLVSGSGTRAPICCPSCGSVENGSCSVSWNGSSCVYTTTCNEGYDLTSGAGTANPVCTLALKTTYASYVGTSSDGSASVYVGGTGLYDYTASSGTPSCSYSNGTVSCSISGVSSRLAQSRSECQTINSDFIAARSNDYNTIIYRYNTASSNPCYGAAANSHSYSTTGEAAMEGTCGAWVGNWSSTHCTNGSDCKTVSSTECASEFSAGVVPHTLYDPYRIYYYCRCMSPAPNQYIYSTTVTIRYKP